MRSGADRRKEVCAVSEHDVIIIGSGAGGGTPPHTLTHTRARSGQRLLLLLTERLG